MSISHSFKEFEHADIPYLLIVKNYTDFIFVKKDYTPTGKFRRIFFKFSKLKVNNSTLEKLNSLQFDNLLSFENLFDKKSVIKEFYRLYKEELDKLANSIQNLHETKDATRYAQIIFDRLIFLYFIQTKLFLSQDKNYLTTKFRQISNERKNYYEDFLKPLFYQVLNKRIEFRTNLQYIDSIEIPFLNGGLFREHELEYTYPNIWISNETFQSILNFLSDWIWYVDEDADFGEDRGLSPEILGHIFEKTITKQREKGAYYTPNEVSNYIAENTVLKYCVGKVNNTFSTRYHEIKGITKNLEHSHYLFFSVIKHITILDNACGSGEFLLAVQKMLFDICLTLWNTISQMKTSEVEAHKKEMSKSKSVELYFKRYIIMNNLYGVDLEEGAVEICKLRLWLSLVSEMSIQDLEPLPNIDYNILLGNSLLGFNTLPTEEQLSLDDPRTTREVFADIDKVKRTFSQEEDPETTKKLKIEIDSKIKSCETFLNRRLAAQFASDGLHYSVTDLEHPLHWRLKFSSIFSKHQGFDIILGNPPYIKAHKVRSIYPTKYFDTESCDNTCAYFFEVSLPLIKPGGYIGFIVPISTISTDSMKPLQKMLKCECENLWISSYDNRPGHIFEGVENIRYAIIIGKLRETKNKTTIFTTKYNRWYSEEWVNVLKNLVYIDSTNSNIVDGTIPKLGTEIAKTMLNYLRIATKLETHISKDSPHKIWFHDSPRYWIRATDFIPKYKSKKDNISSHVKSISITEQYLVKIIISILNSSLFYWYFITVSNCRDLSLREIKNFGIDIKKMSESTVKTLTSLSDELMKDLDLNSETVEIDNKKTGKIVQQKFYSKKSKWIIDKIDEALSRHYGFSDEELHFIKTFDERFRLGEEDELEDPS